MMLQTVHNAFSALVSSWVNSLGSYIPFFLLSLCTLTIIHRQTDDIQATSPLTAGMLLQHPTTHITCISLRPPSSPSSKPSLCPSSFPHFLMLRYNYSFHTRRPCAGFNRYCQILNTSLYNSPRSLEHGIEEAERDVWSDECRSTVHLDIEGFGCVPKLVREGRSGLVWLWPSSGHVSTIRNTPPFSPTPAVLRLELSQNACFVSRVS
jgi:hypothetical protein